jgi:TetR/AcrR family transcriptional regulator, cholesterol catabolism regulator
LEQFLFSETTITPIADAIFKKDPMKNNTRKQKISLTTFSRIKNSDLVRNRQMLIAKKSARLFVKKGYEQTTIREISKATGLAMGNLYDYIKKKEDILCLVFDLYHEIVEESSYGPKITSIEDPLEQMKANIKISMKNIHEFRDEILLMYRESRLLPKKYLDQAKKQELKQIAKTEAIIRNGIEKGFFKVQDPFFTSSMIFCLLASPALRGWTFQGKYSKKKVDKLLEDFVMKILLA